MGQPGLRQWTFESAQARIEKLPQGHSGSYAVIDHRTGNRISFASKMLLSGATTKPEDGIKDRSVAERSEILSDG
jgi:hypothetical protein